jgi:hypothetical protein
MLLWGMMNMAWSSCTGSGDGRRLQKEHTRADDEACVRERLAQETFDRPDLLYMPR